MAPDALAEVGTAEQIPMELSKDGASAALLAYGSYAGSESIRKHGESELGFRH
jgi:hypothetical protein